MQLQHPGFVAVHSEDTRISHSLNFEGVGHKAGGRRRPSTKREPTYSTLLDGGVRDGPMATLMSPHRISNLNKTPPTQAD